MRTKRSCVCLLLALFVVGRGAADTPETADLIISNGRVLTMDESRTALDDGVVVIRGDAIAAVGGRELLERYRSGTVIDAGGDLVMPGMINLHNHLSMVAFRGLGETNFKDRLFRVMFPLEKALLSRELIRVAARQAAIESALSGVTTVTDMYYHEDEVALSVAEVGLRGVLGETVIGFPVVDAAEPYGGLAYAEQFISDWKGHDLITPAVAPHAPYTVSPEWLKKSRELAEREGVPVLMHVAEMRNERELMAANIGPIPADRSIIEYLDDVGLLSDNLVAAHVSHVDDADIALLARRGVGVAHNPKANSRATSGEAPAWRMLEAGVDIGLGTDGPMSSNQMDIINVLGYAAVVARNSGAPDSRRLPPYDLVYLSTMGGARALDMEGRIGSLEAGKQADIIIIDAHAANMQPMHDPYAMIAFAAYPQNVHTTIVDGRVVVRDGAVQTVDLEAHATEWAKVVRAVAEFATSLE